MKTSQGPRESEFVVKIDGETYLLASPSQQQELGARAWVEEFMPAQTTADVDFEIPIVDFSAGSGFTFEGPPGTYDSAHGFDASSPGRPTTWPRIAMGESFVTTDMKGWEFFVGNYLYVARGQYVVKYAINETPGSTWPIVEIHDLGSGIVCAGRPAVFQSKAYVPRRSGPTGTVQVFHELTTIVNHSDEVQTIVISGTPTGGTYTVTFDGKTTAAIAYNASGAVLQAALRLIPGLEKVTVVTTGSTPNFTHTVTLTGVGGSLGAGSPPQMTSTSSMTGGTPVITHNTTNAGSSDTWTAAGSGYTAARCFTVWENKLVLGNGNYVRTCATAPTTSANWAPQSAAGYEVGDSGRDITDLGVYGRYLVVGKVDGLWTFDENLNTVNETPDLQDAPDDNNCIGMGMSLGYMLIPHKAGLVRWRPGAWEFIGPEQEGFLEGDKSDGWGRVSGVARYGRYAFVSMNNVYSGKAGLGSLQPGSDRRAPVTPHSHQEEADSFYETVAVLGTFTQPAPALTPSVAVNDSAVGTVNWANLSNAQGGSDGTYATADVGTSRYLKLTGIGAVIPNEATILGVTVEIIRSVLGSTTHAAAAALVGSAAVTAVGTKTP